MTVQAARCDHCGRPVQPTLHGRRGARVDYFRSVIGAPRVDLIDDPAEPGSKSRVVRVEGLHEVTTCRDCWARPEARAELETAWRTGVL